MTAGINGFLRIPSGEHNAWLFSLSYSPTNQLPYPIPTVAYVWQPSEFFRMNVGLPFMLMWRPTEDCTLDISYMLLTTLHARISYRLSQQASVYLAYTSESEAYLLADRINNNDRFFNVDQRASTGVKLFLTKKASLDFSGGYSGSERERAVELSLRGRWDAALVASVATSVPDPRLRVDADFSVAWSEETHLWAAVSFASHSGCEQERAVNWIGVLSREGESFGPNSRGRVENVGIPVRSPVAPSRTRESVQLRHLDANLCGNTRNSETPGDDSCGVFALTAVAV
jgi:hypothetical protein